MSKKLLASAIIFLALGGVMIPGGFIINNVIQDLTYSSIDEGLLGIKEEAVPIIKESATDGGMKALLFAFETIKELGTLASENLANATIFMGQIYSVEKKAQYSDAIEGAYFDWLNGSYIGTPENYYFSNLTESQGYPPIKGISEWYGRDLNFSNRNITALIPPDQGKDLTGGVQRLKYGINTDENWWGNRLPGFYEDTYKRVGDADWPPENLTDSVETVDMDIDRGFGVLQMLALIERASKTQLDEMAGPNGYNLYNPSDIFTYNGVECNKLEILYFYYTDYYINEVLSMIIAKFNYKASGVFPDINPLWGEYPQYQRRDWNGNDTSYDDLTYFSLIEQWAKCNSFDEGFDAHNSDPAIPSGTYGIEPGGPGESSGIPMQAALQLWNETNDYSLLNLNGLYKWQEAYTNTTIFEELLLEFSQYPGYNDGEWNENDTYLESDWGFNETDMNLLLDWLWGEGGGWGHGSFFEDVLPELITPEIAFHILLGVWANGTVFGEKLYPNGFPLPLGFAEIKGLEVGYKADTETVIPSNISLESALSLWDDMSDYSLTTKLGLQKWFTAVDGNSEMINTLKEEHNLTDSAIKLLLEWIPNFQNNVMPYLAQYQYQLPTDTISLGNLIQIGGIGLGATLIGIGSVSIAGTLVSRRKRLNPFELGN